MLFHVDPITKNICAYDTDTDFGEITLCQYSDCAISPLKDGQSRNAEINFETIYPVIHEEECLISEPDITPVLLGDSIQADGSVVIFDGTGGMLKTQDILDTGEIGDPSEHYTGPSINSVGNLINAIVESNALEYGAGCFNWNCLDLVSMADTLDDGELANELDLNFPASEIPPNYSSASQYINDLVSTELTNIQNNGLHNLLNDFLGLQIPDPGPCPEDEEISMPLMGFNEHFSQGKDNPLAESGNNGDPCTGADMDYFSSYIPGLGAEGERVSTPSPSALEMIKSVKGGVNLYNGSQSTSIPLHTVQSNDLSIPISLSSSNNGLKVDDLGSLVGQNWNLNAGGMISRVVKGLPDEFSGKVNGKGAGRGFEIKGRFEFPSNMGLEFKFPGSGEIGCVPGMHPDSILKRKLNLGFSSDKSNFLKVSWTPIRANLVNFTIKIPIPTGVPTFKIFLEVGFNVGLTLNETLTQVKYEEEGLGFLHLDDSDKMDDKDFKLNPLPDPLISGISDNDEKLKVLRKVHANRNLDDIKFLNDQAASWNNWIDAIKETHFNGVTLRTQRLDTEPDEFFYSCGNYSGKFSFNTDGIPVLFPHYDGLKIDYDINLSEEKIKWFSITTPDGMKYTFGNTGEIAGQHQNFAVDITKNTNYYLPNFYTYPEEDLNRERFGKAEVEVARMSQEPFFGPKQMVIYGNTYERNYRKMDAPSFSSAWHLVKKESLLTLEKINLNYDSRTLRFYPDKNYTHSFPNFDTDDSEYELKTKKNKELNPLHVLGFKTKWENGRAEFAYSAIETNTTRWHLTDINTERGETAHFIYRTPRGEIYDDYVCDTILINRNNAPFKGWKLNYNQPESNVAESTCDPLANGAPINIDGETKFNLGQINTLWWEKYNNYFFINFSLGCIRIPIRIPLPFDALVHDNGYRTEMSEFGSLMEVKSKLGFFDRQREEMIFHAEKQRTFLNSVEELDRNVEAHDFVTSIEYKGNEYGMPKRFSLNQDLFGYYNDNPSGNPFPAFDYMSINNNHITNGINLI